MFFQSCFLPHQVAAMIKGKSQEEIRQQFKITSDFTPEEEEQARTGRFPEEDGDKLRRRTSFCKRAIFGQSIQHQTADVHTSFVRRLEVLIYESTSTLNCRSSLWTKDRVK